MSGLFFSTHFNQYLVIICLILFVSCDRLLVCLLRNFRNHLVAFPLCLRSSLNSSPLVLQGCCSEIICLFTTLSFVCLLTTPCFVCSQTGCFSALFIFQHLFLLKFEQLTVFRVTVKYVSFLL